jgi:hypothetical protein
MLKFIANALLSIVMEKTAREKLLNNHPVQKDQENQPQDSRTEDMQALKENIGRVMTPERQELIRNAMAIQRSKAKVLDDLKDEDKQKLYAIAIKNLLREGREETDE